MSAPPRRLLFVAEGVTLAHVGRPLLLAQAMAAQGHEVVFAAPDRYRRWAPAAVGWRTLKALTPEAFAARLAAGRPLYGQGQLKGYIADDLNLMAEVRPDVVIGDFRLSLAASARTAGVPYAALANAYWSPQRRLRPPPPALHGAAFAPPWAARLAFRAAWPWALARHARAIGEVLAPHGVEVGQDLRRAYTEADVTLYADHPALFPEVTASEREQFLGPLAWAPDLPLPGWWADIPAGKPLAYVSLGSSGDAAAAPRIVEALVAEGFAVIAATAGRVELAPQHGVFAADYLPGGEACARADLVVCNGGSPGVNQALSEGRPVLGVCTNLDQFLNMQAVQARRCGLMLRSDGLTPKRLRQAIRQLRDPAFAANCETLAAQGALYDPVARFAHAVEALVSAAGPGSPGPRSGGRSRSRRASRTP